MFNIANTRRKASLTKIKGRHIPSPSLHHAGPSVPWPWVDINDDLNVDQKELIGSGPSVPAACDHEICDNCWMGYPQSLFPNWTRTQMDKSGITEVLELPQDETCILYQVDVDGNGYCGNAEKLVVEAGMAEDTWKRILKVECPPSSRTRAVFIENLSGPIMQMLGAKHKIEPFFFSSSLNWIPSRSQAYISPGVGDSLTITLTFLRSVSSQKMPNYREVTQPYFNHHSNNSRDSISSIDDMRVIESTLFGDSIDTKAPLKLRYCTFLRIPPHLLLMAPLPTVDRYLCLDLLSVHVIRNINGNNIISYHPDLNLPTTRAEKLYDRFRFANKSVYWQNMFQQSRDPTLLLLTFIWHAVCSWSQALEDLYGHICQLESGVIYPGTWRMHQDLYIIRVHQLYYHSLLVDVRKTVEFIHKNKNPAMTSEQIPQQERELNGQFLERECDSLIFEIERLIGYIEMQMSRLKDMIDLASSSTNVSDSRRMRDTTEKAKGDRAAMRQVTYLTMVFLPPLFVAVVFGMNTREISPGTNLTIPGYLATAIPFSCVTIWIIIAFQSRFLLRGSSFVQRLAWPVLLVQHWWHQKGAPASEAVSRDG